MMQLREIMRTRLVTIGPNEVAREAWIRMRRHRIRHFGGEEATEDSSRRPYVSLQNLFDCLKAARQ